MSKNLPIQTLPGWGGVGGGDDFNDQRSGLISSPYFRRSNYELASNTFLTLLDFRAGVWAGERQGRIPETDQ